MFTKVILGICIACAIFLTAASFPVDTITTKTGKIYKLVPLTIGSDKTLHHLQRARRDNIFPKNNNDQKEPANTKAEPNHVVILQPTRQEGNQRVLKQENKETLKTAEDTMYPVVYRVRRANEGRRRYDDGDNYYDESDYAGYDRKGSDVGYMDESDDFPTVVW